MPTLLTPFVSAPENRAAASSKLENIMNRLVGLLGMILLAAAPCWGQESERTPSKQQEALVKEYQTLLDAFEKAYREIQDEAQQEAFYEKDHPQPERFYSHFMALAEKHPQDPAAVDALIWVVTHSFYESRDEATQKKAWDRLRENHLTSEKLPLVFDWADEKFLRVVLEKSPHRIIRGLAGYTLAEKQFLRLQMISRWRAEYPDWKKRWPWLEQTQKAYLVTTDVDQAGKENEKLLERVVRDFADVPIEDRRKGKTVGELAKGHLHEIRKSGNRPTGTRIEEHRFGRQTGQTRRLEGPSRDVGCLGHLVRPVSVDDPSPAQIGEEARRQTVHACQHQRR
jgi:hypothetical protein